MGLTPRQHTWATVGGFAAILLWSTTVALARSLSEQLGSLTAAAGVYAVSGAAALVSIAWNKSTRRELLHHPRNYLFGCGSLFVGYMIVLYLGLGLADNRQQALEVGLLNYLWPVLTLLLSVLLLGNTARWTLIPGTLLALVGIVLVVMPSTQVSELWAWPNVADSLVPRSLGLTAALAWALYSILTRRWAAERNGGAVNLFLLITALVLGPLCFFVPEPRLWSLSSCVETLFLGGATYLGYRLWDTAMRRGHIVLVAAASYLTPLLSTVFSCVYLGVYPGPALWGGCLLLMAGSLLSWFSVRRPFAERSAAA